jgi:opacity protein-like surface antigen
MGRLKTLWSIGIILGLSAPAVAADFSPPPPPPPGPIVSELGSGWYLRGDLGYLEYSKPKEDPFGQPGAALQNLRLRDEFSVGGGFGYQFTNWLRADVTADYRNKSNFGAVSSRTGFREGYNSELGSFESTTVLLNGYLDVGKWWGVAPYVGAGVGFAQNRFRDYYSETTCVTSTCGDDPTRPGFVPYTLGPQGKVYRPKSSDYNLAWALMAGVAVDVGYGFKLDLGYRYVNLGEAKTKLDAYGFGTKLKPIEAQEVRLGVRYMID